MKSMDFNFNIETAYAGDTIYLQGEDAKYLYVILNEGVVFMTESIRYKKDDSSPPTSTTCQSSAPIKQKRDENSDSEDSDESEDSLDDLDLEYRTTAVQSYFGELEFLLQVARQNTRTLNEMGQEV